MLLIHRFPYPRRRGLTAALLLLVWLATPLLLAGTTLGNDSPCTCPITHHDPDAHHHGHAVHATHAHDHQHQAALPNGPAFAPCSDVEAFSATALAYPSPAALLPTRLPAATNFVFPTASHRLHGRAVSPPVPPPELA